MFKKSLMIFNKKKNYPNNHKYKINCQYVPNKKKYNFNNN